MSAYFLSPKKRQKSYNRTKEWVKYLSNLSWLKPNKTKYEVVGIGVLDGVQVALCGKKCVNSNNKALEILGVHSTLCNRSEKGSLKILT